MFRRQTSIEYRFPKYQAHHHWFFPRQCQNPHLKILGSLVFCVGLTFSEPVWSVPSVGAAALSVSQIDQRVSTVVTTASTDSDAIQSPAGELPQAVRGEATVDHDAEQGDTLSGCDRKGARGCFQTLYLPVCCKEAPPQPPLKRGENPLKVPLFKGDLGGSPGLKTRPRGLGLSASNSPPSPQSLVPSPSENSENPPRQPPLDPVSEVTGQQTPTHQESVELPVLNPESGLPSQDSNLVPKLTSSTRKTNDTQTTVSPIPGASVLGTQHSGLLTEDSQEQKQQSHPTPLSSPRQVASSPTSETQPSPMVNSSESEQPSNSADPELGNLRLRELPAPPLPSKPTVFLLGGVSYFRSNNIFSGVNPVDDGLVGAGLTLLTTPSLGPQTSLFASVNGNIIRYAEQSEFDYNQLRFSLGIRQQLSPRAYGEVGWSNRQLFEQDGGEQFLNEHSLYLQLGRRDLLAKQLTLDTFYQFRFSFADPSNRTQAINYLGASLGYNLNPSLQVGLDYQFALANFTEQERLDQYHQLIARLTYTMSPNSQLYLFGGHSFGSSSDPYIDFDGLVFGVGVDFSLTLF